MLPEATKPVETTGVETNKTTKVTENKEATYPQDTGEDQIDTELLSAKEET